MAAKLREARLAELRKIQAKHRGLLPPKHVVAFARDPKSALHGHFQWDDGKAAHQHRLWQARQLIDSFEIVREGSTKPTPVFVSLESDRASGRGYREMSKILTSEELTAQMLASALKDLNVLKERYQSLTELTPIWRSMDDVSKKRSRKRAAA
jgi:hypothetical protein